MSGAIKAIGTIVNDTGAGRTVAWPAGHKSGDYAILIAAKSDTTGGLTETLSTPAGFAFINSAEGVLGGIFTRITAWWCVATSSAMSSPVIAPAGLGGDSACAVIVTCSGCFNQAPEASAAAATTTDAISIPTITTLSDNALVLDLAAQFNSGATESISGWTNAALANLAEYCDQYAATVGIGAQPIGIAAAAGMMRAHGATGATTATWTGTGSFISGAVIKLALKPATTTAVTQDATDQRWYPSTEAEFCSLLDGDAFPTPDDIWPMQEASGNLIDALGNQNLTAFNAPQYQQAVTGHTRKAIRYLAANDCHYTASAPADGLGNITSFSSAIFGAVGWSGAPTVAKNMINLGAGSSIDHAQLTTTPHYQIVGTSQATGTGAANPSTNVRPLIFQVDRANAAIVLQTDQETIAPAYTAPTGGTGYLSLGPDSVGDSTTSELWLFSMAWAGRKAEFSATMRATLIDRHLNGPRVASIAVTPTPVALSGAGSTQQLTATATRADGSTVDVTATATWSSSAPSVATVSATGLVTAVTAGTANISCTYTSLNAATATSNNSVVTVTTGPTYTGVDVSPSPGQAFIGGTKQFTATATIAGGGTADVTSSAVWSSSSPSVATVGAATGLASGLAAGSTLITATLGAFSSTVGLLVLASAGAANDLSAQQSKLYGEDVWFDVSHADALGNADYVVSPAGDWQDVDGVEALRQSLLRRLITNPGEWATLPDFGVGARQYIKALNTAANRAELEARVRSQFMADDRVESIESVTITEVTGDMPGLTIFVNVIPVGRLRQDATLPVQITIT